MGWDLKFRTRAEMLALTDSVRPSSSAIHYFEESERNIGFVLVRRGRG